MNVSDKTQPNPVTSEPRMDSEPEVSEVLDDRAGAEVSEHLNAASDGELTPSDASTDEPRENEPEGLRKIILTLKLALTGSEGEDFTKGTVGRAVFLLAVPMVLEMFMASVFAICDVFFVSRLGIEAVASVGLTEALITPLYAIAAGFAMAAGAMVARRIGEGDATKAAEAGVQTIWLGLVITLAIAPAGALLAPRLLALMGASPEVVEIGSTYCMILLGGSGSIIMLFLINAIFRGAGDAAVAMRALWLANAVNIVLDPLLIFGIGPFPELGLTGAAIATTIGRTVGVAYQVRRLVHGNTRVRPTLRQLTVVPEVLKRLTRVATGGIVQNLIATASWVGLVRIVGLFGANAVAGYTIAIRIIMFTILPAWGIANAAATLMGQNLGAGKPDRAQESVMRTGQYNAIFLLGVAFLFITSSEALVRIFTNDPLVIANAVDCMHFISYGYGFYGYAMVLVAAFNGAGDTTTPSIMSFVCYWAFQIPLAWVLANSTVLEATGVFVAVLVTEAMLAVVALVVFRRGTWRAREI